VTSGRLDAAPYDQQWRSYRRWSRALWGLWFGWIPYYLVVSGVMHHDAPFWLAFPYVAAFMFAAFKYQMFRCPRCGQTFFDHSRAWPLTSACGHCGLPRWAGSTWRPLG